MTEEEKKKIFEEMLKALELVGKCSWKYHDLAEALFGDRMRD